MLGTFYLPIPRGYGYLGWHVQFEPKVVRSKTIPFWKAYEVYKGAVLWGRGGKGGPGRDSNPKPICETGAGFWQPGAGFSNYPELVLLPDSLTPHFVQFCQNPAPDFQTSVAHQLFDQF